MRRIQLVTFKGCQTTIDFRSQLEELIDEENLDVAVEMVLVPSPEKAADMRLYGSPTIFLDGEELQPERHGPFGFY